MRGREKNLESAETIRPSECANGRDSCFCPSTDHFLDVMLSPSGKIRLADDDSGRPSIEIHYTYIADLYGREPGRYRLRLAVGDRWLVRVRRDGTLLVRHVRGDGLWSLQPLVLCRQVAKGLGLGGYAGGELRTLGLQVERVGEYEEPRGEEEEE